MAKNTICIWYDKDAETAARFYAGIFPDSAVTAVYRAPSDYPSGKAGDVLTFPAGSLVRVIKVLGCVNSTLEYTDQHLVINGCSDLLHTIFGKEGNGYHARSALGFAQLPTGAAVEVEAIFEVL